MDFLYVAISLLGVLGLMFLTFFGLRMFNRRISTSGGRLRVIDRATLGRDSMLLVVSLCGKLMLIGVSAHRVEKLADLEMTEDDYVKSAFSKSEGYKALPFSDILSSFMGRKKTENQDGDEKEDENDKSS